MKAVVWSKPSCVYCEKSKALLKSKGIMYEEKNIAEGYDIQDLLELVPNARLCHRYGWTKNMLVDSLN